MPAIDVAGTGLWTRVAGRRDRWGVGRDGFPSPTAAPCRSRADGTEVPRQSEESGGDRVGRLLTVPPRT